MSLAPLLYDDNPWWESTEKINEDPEIMERERSNIKWDPRIRHTFDFSKDIVYSLRGPRQVGKTTLIKLQIKEFLESGINPWNIMYYTFDVDKSSKNVVEIINNYLTSTKRRRGDNRFYLFLDEVSKVKDWQDGIKRIHDRKKIENCTVIVTGSHTIDLKTSLENLPGRRGETDEAYDKIMLPMKFSEYVAIIDSDLKKILFDNKLTKRDERKRVFKKLLNSEIDESLDKMQAYLNDLNSLLIDYMLTGGNPQVVNAYFDKGTLQEYLYTTYLDYILGDLKSLRRNPIIFRQLIANVIKNIGWPQSWPSLAKDTDIKNPITAGEYIYTLKDMFVLTMFYNYDPEKKRALVRKNKKINFHDPFFLHTLNGWISDKKSFRNSQSYVQNETNQGTILEGIVGDHLIRLAFGLSDKKQNFDYSNYVYYWNIKKGKEVDYILRLGDKIELPIEVKYQNKIEKKHFKGINYFNSLAKTENSVMISKNTIDIINKTVILPASIFLLLV